MTEPLAPPPISENMILNPGFLTKVWVRFFQNMFSHVQDLEGKNVLVVPGRDGQDGEDGYTYPPIPGPAGPAGVNGINGLDGQDGEDGYVYPPMLGANGKDGQIGPPGMDGEDYSESPIMVPPGIDREILKGYFDTLYTSITGRYRYAGALADTDEITLPTITANWPSHGFIHCAHASTGVISDSAEFEFGSDGNVQIIRGSAGIEAGGATAGKISLGPVVDANPVVIKNNIGGGTSVNVMITLWYN